MMVFMIVCDEFEMSLYMTIYDGRLRSSIIQRQISFNKDRTSACYHAGYLLVLHVTMIKELMNVKCCSRGNSETWRGKDSINCEDCLLTRYVRKCMDTYLFVLPDSRDVSLS